MDWLGVLVVHIFCMFDHGESDGLNGIFYNSMHVDVYNMVAPHDQIRVEQVRVEHDRVHEMINDAFGVQGGMEPEQYFDEAPNEEARRFYDQLEESSRPLCEAESDSALRETSDFYSYYFGHDVSCRRNRPNRNDEGDIDPLFPPISIFNQNGRGSKKCRKRGFTDMEMQLAVTHILLNCP
ncbi:hypothetical protein H5410_060330 [Solanum commersonii]|uniref:Uncharacterized protein n=1 Tax=Solanum commersonii TaxID=4109 RepID=A0A9J5W5P5_SOLCO|nr:hypothetical protein H5410_060330 [Solanum commersonii]